MSLHKLSFAVKFPKLTWLKEAFTCLPLGGSQGAEYPVCIVSPLQQQLSHSSTRNNSVSAVHLILNSHVNTSFIQNDSKEL